MDKSEKLKQIQEESKRIFLAETREKINDCLILLLKMRLSHNLKIKNEIKRFFHTVKGSAATYGLNNMAEIGGNIEKLLEDTNHLNEITHKFYSKILEGLAKIFLELDIEANKVTSYKVTEQMEKSVVKGNLDIKREYIFSLGNGLILIVDDDISILNLLDKFLHEKGYKVIAASDPVEVYEILKERIIDLMVMDINMPNLGGLELFEDLRKNNIIIPTMFISTEEKIDTKTKAFQLGAEDYVLKPFEIEEFGLRIERILQNNQNIRKKLYLDGLTGAFSRELFYENFNVAKNLYLKKAEKFTIGVIDIDKFREINSIVNYEMGNYVLKFFYIFLKNNLTPSDQIYRIQADRFLILFPNSKDRDVFFLLDLLRKKFKSTNLDKDQLENIKLTYSAGITAFNSEKDSSFELIGRAESALINAKKSGGDKIVIKKRVEVINEGKKNKKTASILIIEDSKSLINLVKSRLEELDFSVSFAMNGSTGLLMCKATKPDILILDLSLPEMDGFEVCKALKSDDDTKNIKIIVTTSHSSKDVVIKFMNMGVEAFIIKPFQLTELEMRIEKLLTEIYLERS